MEKFIPNPKVAKEENNQAEIKHYLKQLKKGLGTDFTSKLEKEFSQVAKVHQQKRDDLFEYTQDFLKLQKKKRKKWIEKTLERHIESKVFLPESKFKRKGKKETGSTPGYVAIKKDDESGLPFMIKFGIAKYDYKYKHKGKILDRNNDLITMNFVNEYVTASFYKRTLYDRSPIIEGVERSKDPNIVCFRSKFLHEFKTLSQFTGGKASHIIGSGYRKLKDVKGIEKVFAAMLVWGEYDFNAGNLGVMKVMGEGGEEELVFAKIDHGWSATEFFTDPSITLENFADAYKRYLYAGRLPLRIDKFKSALDEITKVSDEEIERIVKSRTYKLKQIGFQVKDLKFSYWENCEIHMYNIVSPNTIKFDDFFNLERYYIDSYKKQLRTMREVSKRLDIISKIDIEDDKWKNGKWLQDIKGEDPIAWAKRNDKKVEGLDPVEWEAKNIKKEDFKISF